MKNIMNVMEDSTYFSGLNTKMIEKILKISSVDHFKKGEYVFFEGSKGEYIFMALSGKIKIFKISASGKEFIIKIIKKEDFFAEALLFDEKRLYPANAQAMENSSVLKINLREFEKLLMEDNEITIEIVKNLSNRLSYLSQRFENLIIGNSVIKVAFFLLDLAYSTGKRENDKIKIKLEMNRETMANMLNLSRENVERVLSYFQSEGLISRGRRYLTIVNPTRLKEMALKE